MKYCINCGTEIPEKAKYCGVCGTAQNESNENNIIENSLTIQSATKKCPYCAEIIKAEATVCRYCNKNIKPNSGSVTRKGYTNIVCVTISFIIEIVLIILMFIPFLNVNYDIGMSSGILAEVNVFTGFDISDLHDKIKAITNDSGSINIGDFWFFVSVFLLIIITVSIIVFIRNLICYISSFKNNVNIYSNCFKSIGSIIFLGIATVLWLIIMEVLQRKNLDTYISVTMHPAVIIMLILLFFQIIVNVVVKKERNLVSLENTYESGYWICKKCWWYNRNNKSNICKYCGEKRHSKIDKSKE